MESNQANVKEKFSFDSLRTQTSAKLQKHVCTYLINRHLNGKMRQLALERPSRSDTGVVRRVLMEVGDGSKSLPDVSSDADAEEL